MDLVGAPNLSAKYVYQLQKIWQAFCDHSSNNANGEEGLEVVV